MHLRLLKLAQLSRTVSRFILPTVISLTLMASVLVVINRDFRWQVTDGFSQTMGELLVTVNYYGEEVSYSYLLDRYETQGISFYCETVTKDRILGITTQWECFDTRAEADAFAAANP